MADDERKQELEAEREAWAADPDKAFEDGVWTALNLWDTLMLAVSNGWGGGNPDDKMDNLYNDLLAVFDEAAEKGNKVYPEMVQPLLAECIDKDFNVDAQDGSAELTARLVCQLRFDCQAGDFDGLARITRRLEKLEGKAIGIREADAGNDVDEEDDAIPEEDEEEEESESESDGGDEKAAEDDEWEVVGKKGKAAKKKGKKKKKKKAAAAVVETTASVEDAAAPAEPATEPQAEEAAAAAPATGADAWEPATGGRGRGGKKKKKKKGGIGPISV